MSGGVRYDRIKQVRVSGRVLIYAPEHSELRVVVDDLDLTAKLQRAGLDVHVVELPDELVRELRQVDPDLVLTDLSSFDSLDEVRGRAAILPVSYESEAAAANDSKGRCVARITKRSGRQFVRVVELILEKRSRGMNFDCGTGPQPETV